MSSLLNSIAKAKLDAVVIKITPQSRITKTDEYKYLFEDNSLPSIMLIVNPMPNPKNMKLLILFSIVVIF